jgi:hypothetical protein
VGLFDSNNAARPANGTATGFQPYDGYLFSMNPNPTAGAAEKNSLTLRVRQPLTSAYDELMNSFNSNSAPTHITYIATGTASPSTPEPTLQAFPTGKALQGSYTVSRTTSASLTFSFSLTGEGLVNFNRSYVVSSPSTYSFDAFALFSLSSNGSNFAIDNVTVTAVPEPSTYAACAGAAVLGLAFWRRRRAAAKATVA